LVAVAKSGLPNHAQGDVAGFWAQAVGGFAEQDAKGEQAGFSVWGLGIALGADMPIFENTHIGISLLESWQTANLKVSNNSPVEFFTTQLSAYGRHQNEHFYTQAIVTAAYNTYESMRNVEFGGIARAALGNWDGYQWGGSLETGTFFNWDLYQLAPYVRGAYVNIHEDSYTETLGGGGINLIVSDKNTDSLRGSVGFAFDRDFPIFYDSYMEAEFRANYTRDIINDPVTLTADFVAAGTPFAVTGNKRSSNRIALGFGVAHKDSYSSVSIDYDTEIASGYMSHTAALTTRFRF
jgi:outer membrane autotransporter protein